MGTSVWEKAKPGVPVVWLFVFAGLVWSGVGLMLCEFAYGWLAPLALGNELLYAVPGLLLAAAIYFFGFSHLARKNMVRLAEYTEKHICAFAFQAWKSYPLVAFMIALGIFLRKYSPIPKPLLAVLYLGLGGGLLLSSFLYHIHWFQMAQNRS